MSIRAGALTTLAQVEKEQAVPLIVKTLASTDPKLRRVALGAVLSVPGNAATKALASEAEALAPEQKAVLIGGLASRGDADGVVEMVNKLASDENEIVRSAAIKALGKLGDASSVAVLTAALKDREASAVASQALIDLRGTGVTEALARQTQASDGATRVALLNVLTERREYEALPVARQALRDETPNTRRAALRTVAVLGTREDLVTLTQLVLNSKDPGERDDLVQAMSEVGGRINDKEARLEPVLQAWSKADAATKVPLLTVLWSFGGEKALETVRGALGANADLHKAAVKVLADWPDPAPMPDLVNLAKNDKETSLRILALRGYIKMAGQPGTRTDTKLEHYKTALELATRPDEKRLVLTGLADVSRVDALKMVEALLEDAALQKEAYFAYEKIAESLAGKEPAVAKKALLKVAEKATDEGLRNKAKKAAEKIQ